MRGIRGPTFLLEVVAAFSACQPPAHQSSGAADAGRAADISWEKAFASRNPPGAAAFLEATGSVLPPQAPGVTGPTALATPSPRPHAHPSLTPPPPPPL